MMYIHVYIYTGARICTEELYKYTSIEDRLWRASLLWRFGATALQQQGLSDGTCSNALSISLFAPRANPVAK